MENVIILGSGCAGLTAAIYTARANLEPLVIEGAQPGGQLTTTTEVENFPGFPEGISGLDLISRLRRQAERFGARSERGSIEKADLAGEVKKLTGAGKTYEAKAVIIATGASPRMLGIPGEREMFGGKGVSTCATCDGAFYRDQEVAVVGGGDAACEEALFLTRFCSKVTIIHRRDELRASKIMGNRAAGHEKIAMRWDTVVEEILPDDSGQVRGIRVKNVQTGAESEIALQGVFIAIGHIPNTQPFREALKTDKQGYFVPETGGRTRTRSPGVFVAGDCADHVYRQAATAAGMGCMAALECERWLAERYE